MPSSYFTNGRPSAFNQSGPSCAVLVRGMADETPYLETFVAHYCALGFQRVYYINTKGTGDYVRMHLGTDLRHRVTVLNLSNERHDWQELVLNEALPLVTEDWLLNIDMDEFLCLRQSTIQDYLSELPDETGKIYFPWIMCLSTEYVQACVFNILDDRVFQSRLFKSMARTHIITACGLHELETTNSTVVSTSAAFANGAFLLHFACRGLYDLMSRIVGRNYENAKSGSQEEARLLAFFRDSIVTTAAYPFRFNLYRIELSFPPSTLDYTLRHWPSAIPTNNELVRSNFVDKMDSIGIHLPTNLGGDLDLYVEERFRIKVRILQDLPDLRFARMHLEQGISYLNITRAYVSSLAKEVR